MLSHWMKLVVLVLDFSSVLILIVSGVWECVEE